MDNPTQLNYCWVNIFNCYFYADYLNPNSIDLNNLNQDISNVMQFMGYPQLTIDNVLQENSKLVSDYSKSLSIFDSRIGYQIFIKPSFVRIRTDDLEASICCLNRLPSPFADRFLSDDLGLNWEARIFSTFGC